MPNNFKKALNLILPFHTMHLSEAAVSELTIIIKLLVNSSNIEGVLHPIP